MGPHGFDLYLINPSRYDDDGYVIYWDWPPLPSNSLACMNGLASDCAERAVLGPDVPIRVQAFDETAGPVPVADICARIGRDGGRGMVGLVGVQTNQFPRAMDLARRFVAAGVPVCIGGFHVSGSLNMLGEPTPELREAMDLGVGLFIGEAEGGRLDEVLRDAHAGALQPIYRRDGWSPGLEAAPVPRLPDDLLYKAAYASPFDAGRGCPFVCSFCTIINVHGRGKRQRRVDDVTAVVRRDLERGARLFMITDDNFARLSNWREVLEALAELQQEVPGGFELYMQVDVPSYRQKGFVDAVARAGTSFVFVGLESLNPDNLKVVSKGQNKVWHYREMVQAWRGAGVGVQVGYILGFPDDTPDSIRTDVGRLFDELEIDDALFFNLTPLPGSEDHVNHVRSGAWIEPDLNRFNLHYQTTEHPRMNRRQWNRAYRRAWRDFYNPRRFRTALQRAHRDGRRTDLVFYRYVHTLHALLHEKAHALECGLGRRRVREERRAGLPLEPEWRFRLHEAVRRATGEAWRRYLTWRLGRIYGEVTGAPAPRYAQ